MKKIDTNFDPKSFESKWQEVWEKSGTFSPDMERAKQPFYNLMMFPYPSAEGLHVGNMYAFTGADVYARYNRMLGKDVFEPIGLDGFGIHSENYALKIGRHPKEQAGISEANFYRQLRLIGNSFDWKRTVQTYNPDYYKWTQWLFIKMFKSGLAYRDKAWVNWCPKDLTVLSDEQVIEGKCERCGSVVEKKELEQWFFRITNYAGRLLSNIDGLNWTDKVKIAQRNWIGKSEGAEIEFKIQNLEFKIEVFTTRPDTLFGATFMVISPEHELVEKIEDGRLEIEGKIKEEVRKYVEETKRKTEIERTDKGREKTGVFSGLYAINPANGKNIPVWIADYVLSSYGTGAIMAVPAHDQRDFEFAKKYNLEIVPVIQPKTTSGEDVKIEYPFTGEGIIIGSESWNGFHVPTDIPKVIDNLEKIGLGKRKENYHLRDWLISRQRYWGPPIPMVFCSSCQMQGKSWFTTNEGKHSKVESSKYQVSREKEIQNTKYTIHNADMAGWYPVPEAQLPVLLPIVSDWKPMGTGKSPLANHSEFYKTTCPECGAEAIRETDVSDTFLDSAWYFLRYPSVKIQNSEFKIESSGEELRKKAESLPFDLEITKKWLPVDQYIGGAEHSVLHLLYSRFVTMALHDMGYLDFEEPFTNFFAHGLIIKDGAKMSKSKGNVVVPDEYIKKYGADTLRTYLMFIGPYSDGGDFRDSGIEGMSRFIRRVWKLVSASIDEHHMNFGQVESSKYYVSGELDKAMHLVIKSVTEDITRFSYNTAIARIMEYVNKLTDYHAKYKILNTKYCDTLLLLLAPFAPHITEELWWRSHQSMATVLKQTNTDNPRESDFNQWKSIHLAEWPTWDEKYLFSDTFIIPIQINGKRRGEVKIGSQELEDASLVGKRAKEVVEKYILGKEVKKVVYIPGKIVNFVI